MAPLGAYMNIKPILVMLAAHPSMHARGRSAILRSILDLSKGGDVGVANAFSEDTVLQYTYSTYSG